MEQTFSFLEEFFLFLSQWELHINSIGFAGLVWIAIVIHLVITGHATFGSNGESKDWACGDIRVWRDIVIFGGPAGITFGIPYYIAMEIFGLSGGIREYWMGFIYLQFVVSVLQTLLLLAIAMFSKRPDESWRLFKSHWKGCGWISALSPVGWILYLIQQFVRNDWKTVFWLLRDVETTLLYVFNIVTLHSIAICLLASVFNQRWIIPAITPIDEDHKKDEDSG